MLLRYTLRLLTLDQLARAATLICALELLRRREARSCWATTRFAIGLWVGQSATANTLKAVAEQINQYKNRRDAGGRFAVADHRLPVVPARRSSADSIRLAR